MQRLELPLSPEKLSTLKAGQAVYLSGTIFTARDCAHKRLVESIQQNRLPISLKDIALYYAGPTPTPPHRASGSCGPTTSMRMDSFTPTLIEQGVRVLIGKGERSLPVIDAIKKYKAIYFAAIGGAGAIYGQCIQSNELIAYPDLLSEGIYKLQVQNFPCIVAVDCMGNSIYK